MLALSMLFACAEMSLNGGYAPPVAMEDSESLYDDEVSDVGDTGDTSDAFDVCDRAIDVPHTLYMSADDSNSQAQPALARQSIEHAQSLYGTPRYYEFLNYYDFDFPSADKDTVRVVPQLRLIDGETDRYTLLVGVVSEPLVSAIRRPANLVFSVDTSGSMDGEPLDRARDVLDALNSNLREGDTISLVTWDSSPKTLLDGREVNGPNDWKLDFATWRLRAGGSTNLAAGLRTAYDLAERHASADSLNRVVLISDGGANTGVTEEEIIGGGAADETEEGIYLTAVGVDDPGGYSMDFMDQISDLGKGAHIFIDSTEEAEKMFATERFLSNLEIAARDVRLTMTLPPGFVIEEFHGEQISTDAADVEPQHLAPNDQMLYHQVIQGCLDDTDDQAFTFEVTFQDPDSREDRTVSLTRTVSELLNSEATELAKADALVAYAKALYGEAPADVAADAIAAAQAESPGDADLAEIAGLLEQTGL